ncbi:PEP-CTERM sorting domain-containing protein [Pseudoduganella plicata]|nr:PEP-CTERM sorting domain-containing protein [Pseudoduganella plicata]
MERVNQPSVFDESGNWIGYSQYVIGDGFAGGVSYGMAPVEDTLLSTTVDMSQGNDDYLEKFSKPFFVELVTNSVINGYPPVSGPAPYASMMWRDVTVRIEMVPVAAVPEPGTWMMLLAGLAGVGVATRRRQS